MDPLLPFALTLGMIIAASEQAAIMERYAAHAHEARPMMVPPATELAPVPLAAAPAPAPMPGWVAGAALGSQVGAALSAANPVVRCRGRRCDAGLDPAPIVAGAVIGGIVGQATSARVVHAAPGPAVEEPRHRSATSSLDFTRHWQEFMQPSGRRESP